jgi:spore cortex biosynthesis protein YabQ
MVLSIDTQIYYFISTIIAGIFIGIMFDVYRILRGFKGPNKVITAISDLLFWILAALIVFIFFLYTNNGDLRYYTFIGLSFGIFIYFKLISRRLIYVLRRVIYFTLKFFRVIINLIFYPIRLLRYFLKYLIFKIKGLKKISLNGKLNKLKNLLKRAGLRRKNKF